MQLKDQIEAIANTLLPGFVPRDKNENKLSFHFTLPPDSTYRVFFERNSKLEWLFISYEVVER